MKKRTGSAKISLLRLQQLLLMILLILILTLGLRLTDSQKPETAFETAVVQYVVDGDTIYADIGGKRTKVRLLGIDTPESVSRTEENTPEGDLASDYLRNLLLPGDTIYLQYDTELLDRYDRTLAYVWLVPDADSDDYRDFCKYNVSALILQNTYCEILNYAPNTKYKTWFERLADKTASERN